MAKVLFNSQGLIETPTLLLQHKNFETIGNGGITNVSGLTYKNNFNDANEVSFKIHKFNNEKKHPLWDSMVDFKIIYIPQLHERFEISVTTSEEDPNDISKSITGTSLCEAELSQITLRNVQINTETDMTNPLYDENFPTILYRDPEEYDSVENLAIWAKSKYDYLRDKTAYPTEESVIARKKTILKHASLLHRVLEKAPHYSISCVADTLKKLKTVHEFTFDGTDILSALKDTIADDFHCVFIFNSENRTISVLDLYSTCNNCGYRGDYMDECPECGSNNITNKYGEDTNILINSTILSKFRVVYQCGNLIIGHYGNKFDIYSITGNTLDLTYVCDTTEWVHCCMTYQSSNNTVTIYINGVKCSTSQPKNLTGLSGTTALIGKRSSETYLFEGYLNDFRIYNTCLSPRQVKEISEGLVCHYPLGEVDGKIGGRNLIKNGKGNVKAGFFKNFPTVTDEYGEFTLKSKKTYKGIILDGFVYECRDYPVGEKYTWSYDIMYTAWNFPTGSNRGELWMGQRYVNAPSGETATGAWRGVTQHNLPVVGQNGCELNKWYHVKQTVTIPQQASSNVGQQGIISFYNSNANVEASFTARLKNVKLEKSSTATPWTPAPEDDASFYDNVIYDTSGYCNNGSVTDSTCPTWSSDTPRYKGSYAFNGNKQYVNCGTSTMIEGQEEITINCWAYMDDWTKFNARLFSCTEGGGYNTEGVNNSIKFALNIYITSDKSKYDYVYQFLYWTGLSIRYFMMRINLTMSCSDIYSDRMENKLMDCYMS